LVGYVTPVPGAQITEASVRKEMNHFAPTYMVPARMVVLPTLPLTATGKVDRRALPAPATTRPELGTPFVAPGNDLEQQIADIWAELLGVDDIGIHDNFFELGGDSITAMRMILRAEELTGSITPLDYFRAPTIAALVALSAPGAPVAPNPASNAVLSRTPPSPANRNLFARLANGQHSASSLLNGLSRAMINRRVLGMPYAEGIRWLAWLGQPAIAHRLFSHERTWFRTLAQELDNLAAATDEISEKSLDNSFSLSVVGNLIRYNFQQSWLHRRSANGDLLEAMRFAPERFWRTFAQQFEQAAPDPRAQLFQVRGLEHLVHAQKRKKGTILLTYHSTASALANVMLARQTSLGKIPTISLKTAEDRAEQEWEDEWGEEGDRPQDEARLQKVSASWAATYALQTQRILLKGGVVRIVNDMSYDAPNSIPKAVGRRQYNLKAGFAELALTTGATVLPVYSTFDIEGRVHLTILPALITQPNATALSGDKASIHNLLNQYSAFLETTWRKSPESIGWGSLHRYNQRQLAVETIPALASDKPRIRVGLTG
jgi:lauroyl/myristoyl acyltransferase/acyl carrier protein